jgi:hypothetical protein
MARINQVEVELKQRWLRLARFVATRRCWATAAHRKIGRNFTGFTDDGSDGVCQRLLERRTSVSPKANLALRVGLVAAGCLLLQTMWSLLQSASLTQKPAFAVAIVILGAAGLALVIAGACARHGTGWCGAWSPPCSSVLSPARPCGSTTPAPTDRDLRPSVPARKRSTTVSLQNSPGGCS